MTLWLVRAGRRGEREQVAMDRGIVTIGWEKMPDLSKIKDRGELLRVCEMTYPDSKKMQLTRYVGQLWTFSKEIKINDLVALPLKTESMIALGKITGDYKFEQIDSTAWHTRKVQWIKKIPRSAFDQDLLYSLGAFTTVCEIKRNDAERRIMKMIDTNKNINEIYRTNQSDELGSKKNLELETDIEEFSKDIIIKYIQSKFSGHGLAKIIESVLRIQGYTTLKSEPGKDEGIDILAGSGPFGFNEPRICVQVKSSDSPVDVRVLRELRGVKERIHANQGLLVSWGGFTKDAISEAKSDFFSIRLWDQGTILEQITSHYEHFDDELKTELPLKRIWTLVKEVE